MSLTPKDMDFIEAKNGAAREIALAFGVPPMLLGIPGDNTYANYQRGQPRLLARHRAAADGRSPPRSATGWRRRSRMARWMVGDADQPRLWFDADQVEALSADRAALWARVAAGGFSHDDEKRAAVGYEPVGEG